MSGAENGFSPGGEIRLKLFGRTDVGQIREHNEDNFLIADLSRQSRSLMEQDREQVVGKSGTVVAVCDGMGGAAAGEVASKLAVDIIYEKMLAGGPPTTRDDLARRLVGTVEEAGLRIFNEARADLHRPSRRQSRVRSARRAARPGHA
jgi:serine/threonine protein phosphatase PrpC